MDAKWLTVNPIFQYGNTGLVDLPVRVQGNRDYWRAGLQNEVADQKLEAELAQARQMQADRAAARAEAMQVQAADREAWLWQLDQRLKLATPPPPTDPELMRQQQRWVWAEA